MVSKNPFAARLNKPQPVKKAVGTTGIKTSTSMPGARAARLNKPQPVKKAVGTTGIKTSTPMPGARADIGFPATNTNTGRTVSPAPVNNSAGLIGGRMAPNIR